MLAIWTSPKAKLSTVDCLEADRFKFYYRIAAQVQRNCVSKLWKLSRKLGFRPERSTVTALLSVLHEWFLTLEDGNEVCAIFLDYKKAFDSVPHRPLLDKLLKIGFNNYIVRWVTSYLTCRSHRVVVNGESSSQVPVVSGVPQGSVLGPLLFIIYINDLAECNFCPGSKLVMYADDVLLYRNILRAEDYVSLQADLDTIDEWSSSNYLQFNLSKCKYMIMSRKKMFLLLKPPSR